MSVLGALLLTAAAVLGGFYMGDIVEKRCRVLNECVNLVRFIASLIDYTDEPLQKIIHKAANSADYRLLRFLEDVDRADYSDGFDSVWCRSIDEHNGKLLFDSKTNELLKSFGSRLGKTDAAGQKELCAYYEQQLVQELEAATDKKREQIKLCRVVGCAVGTLLFVLVI